MGQGFDVAAALEAGATPSDVAQYLSRTRGFKYDDAIKSGATDDDIIAHLKDKGLAEQPERTLGGTVQDVAATAAKGVTSLSDAAIGLANIPTMGHAGRAADLVGLQSVYDDPREAEAVYNEQQALRASGQLPDPDKNLYSPAQQWAQQQVSDADGVGEKLIAAVENPSTIAQAVGESLPASVVGGMAGRAISTVAPKVSPVVGAAIGEGAIQAGSAAENIRRRSESGTITPTQSAISVASGAGTGIFALVGGRVASKLGVADFDTWLAGQAGRSGARSVEDVAARIIGGGISEGVFEELPQSVQEQMWMNAATGKPLTDGVDEAAVMGGLSGFAMGGGFNAISGSKQQRQTPAPTPQDELAAFRAKLMGQETATVDDEQGRERLINEASLDRNTMGQVTPENSMLAQQGDERTPTQERAELAADYNVLFGGIEDTEKTPGRPTVLTEPAPSRLGQTRKERIAQRKAELAAKKAGQPAPAEPVQPEQRQPDMEKVSATLNAIKNADADYLEAMAAKMPEFLKDNPEYKQFEQQFRQEFHGRRRALAGQNQEQQIVGAITNQTPIKEANGPVRGTQETVQGVDTGADAAGNAQTGAAAEPAQDALYQQAKQYQQEIGQVPTVGELMQQFDVDIDTASELQERLKNETDTVQQGTDRVQGDVAAGTQPGEVIQASEAQPEAVSQGEEATGWIRDERAPVESKKLAPQTDIDRYGDEVSTEYELRRDTRTGRVMIKRTVRYADGETSSGHLHLSKARDGMEIWGESGPTDEVKTFSSEEEAFSYLKEEEGYNATEDSPKNTASPTAQNETQTDLSLTGETQSPVDEAAKEAAHSPENDLAEPTDAQKDAGNYKKGHVRIHGLDVSIENPAGSTRSGTDPNGKRWETPMRDHYGYFKGTVGKDKDHIDVFIPEGFTPADGDMVAVVDQIDPKTGRFDEHKVIMGATDEQSARETYLRNYDETGPSRIGAVTVVPVQSFKDWLEIGDNKKPFGKIDVKPTPSRLAEQRKERIAARRAEMQGSTRVRQPGESIEAFKARRKEEIQMRRDATAKGTATKQPPPLPADQRTVEQPGEMAASGQRQIDVNTYTKETAPYQVTKQAYVDGRYRSPAMHKTSVDEALKNGIDVDSRVLSDYPDLAEKYGNADGGAKKQIPVADSKLETAVEIQERIKSIQRQIEAIDNSAQPKNEISYEKRNQKYAKLVSRREELSNKLRKIEREGEKQATKPDQFDDHAARRDRLEAMGEIEVNALREKYSQGSDDIRHPIEVKVTISKMTDIVFLEMKEAKTPQEKYSILNRLAKNIPDSVKIKIGSGQFRDQVDLNSAIRNGGEFSFFELSPRRGYHVATFLIDPTGKTKFREKTEKQYAESPSITHDPDDESRYYGTRVTIKGVTNNKGAVIREEKKGTIQRTMVSSGGYTLIEVEPDGVASSFRYKPEDLVIDELVDRGPTEKPATPETLQQEFPEEIATVTEPPVDETVKEENERLEELDEETPEFVVRPDVDLFQRVNRSVTGPKKSYSDSGKTKQLSPKSHIEHTRKLIKKFVKTVPEFDKAPVFTVAKDKRNGIVLRFTDSFQYDFFPVVFGLEKQNLKVGQHIRIDLDAWLERGDYKGVVYKSAGVIDEESSYGKGGWWSDGSMAIAGGFPKGFSVNQTNNDAVEVALLGVLKEFSDGQSINQDSYEQEIENVDYGGKIKPYTVIKVGPQIVDKARVDFVVANVKAGAKIGFAVNKKNDGMIGITADGEVVAVIAPLNKDKFPNMLPRGNWTPKPTNKEPNITGSLADAIAGKVKETVPTLTKPAVKESEVNKDTEKKELPLKEEQSTPEQSTSKQAEGEEYKGFTIKKTDGVQVGYKIATPGQKKTRKVSGYDVTDKEDGYTRFFNTKKEALAWVDEYVGGNTEDTAQQPEQPVEQEAAAAPPVEDQKTIVDQHYATIEHMQAGTVTVEDYQAAFGQVYSNKDAIIADLSKMTKDQLLKRMGGYSSYRYKNEKKDFIIKSLYQDMLTDYNLSDMFSYSMGQKIEDVMREKVQKATKADLEAYAAKYAERLAERKKELEQVKQALQGNLETIDDYRLYLRAKMSEGMTLAQARRTLPIEDRAKFDDMEAALSREQRKNRKEQEKTSVYSASVKTTGEIIETKHTKTGEPLFVVQAGERVEREVYNHWNATAKRMGGHYSSYRGGGAVPGFQFKTREAADAFAAFLGGETGQAKELIKERRSVYEDDKEQSAAERLRTMADALEERADENLNRDRKANTVRRARMASNAEASAESDKAMAKTMRNVADAIESGSAKFLDRVRTKSQIEMLLGYISGAKWNYLNEKYQNNYTEAEKHKYDKPTAEIADYIDYPRYSAFRSDLASIARRLAEKEGSKKVGESLLKVADDVTDAYLKFAKENLHLVSRYSTGDGKPAVFASRPAAEAAIKRSGYKGKAIVLPFKRGQNIIIMSPQAAREAGLWKGDDDKRITLTNDFGAEVLEKGKMQKVDVPWYFDRAKEHQTRIKSMGIETPAELRAAVRELITAMDMPASPSKVKELEREMAGRRVKDGLDFFPTPETVARDMVETAGVEEGMSVLEPSAGMGHIAEIIREAGVDPDVVELSSNRRELLDAKGFNVVGNDFMDVDGQYDRIIMNPPFSDRRDVAHVRHAYDLLKPGGRLVAIMGEGSFFGSDKKATEFREWLESVGGTSEKLEEGTFNDPSLPVTTGVNTRMVVIDKDKDVKSSDKGFTVYSKTNTIKETNAATFSIDPISGAVSDEYGQGSDKQHSTGNRITLFVGDTQGSRRDTLREHVDHERIGTVKTRQKHIDTPEKVAELVAPRILRSAQEYGIIVATGKNEEPIAVLQHSYGKKGETRVDNDVISGFVHNTDGAENFWFVHNHPNGSVALSKEDLEVAEKLRETTLGTGIKFRGFIAITPTGQYSYLSHDDPPSPRTGAKPAYIPFVERKFDKMEPFHKVATWGDAQAIIEHLFKGKDGVLLMNSANSPLGFVELSESEFIRLRAGKKGEGASRLLQAMEAANASSYIVSTYNVNHNDLVPNVVRFLAQHGGNIQAAFNQGQPTDVLDTVVPDDPFYSRTTTPSTGSTVSIGKQELSGQYNPDRVTIVQSESELPDGAQVLNNGNSKVQGAFFAGSDQVYLVADGISTGEWKATILHEGFHRAMATGKFADELAELARLDRIAERGTGSVSKWFTDARKAAAIEKGKPQYIDEIGAYAVSQYEKAPNTIQKWVDKLIAKVRLFLRQIGVKVALTPAMLREIAARGLRAKSVGVEEGGFSGELAPAALYSKADIIKHARAFYSKLQQVADDKFQGMKAQSVEPFLLKQGVKKAEIEATGLREWLAAMKPTDKVTKEQLSDFVQANTVEFEDVVLGGAVEVKGWTEFDRFGTRNWMDGEYKFSIEERNGQYVVMEQIDGMEIGSARTLEGAKNIASDYASKYSDSYGSTHFSQYTEPGAKEGSYREMFVTAPGVEFPSFEKWSSDPRNHVVKQHPENIQKSMYEAAKNLTGVWQDGHSQYSEIKNPIVRIRFNEVTIDGPDTERLRNEWLDIQDDETIEDYGPWKKRHEASQKRILRIEEMQGPSPENQKKMPKHLKDSIYQIGVKRILAYAKENGFNGVALATKPGRTAGETQADRYSLEKQIEKIAWDDNRPSGNKHVLVDAKDGNGFQFSVNKDGRITSGPSSVNGRMIDEAVGKDAAEKIMGRGEGELTGLDLKVGGEGLKKLYDRDLPNIFKAWGGVEMGSVGFDPQEVPTKDRYTGKFFFGENSPQFETRDEANKWLLDQSSMPYIPITERTASSFPMFSRTQPDPAEDEGSITERINEKPDLLPGAAVFITPEYSFQLDPAAQRAFEANEQRRTNKFHYENFILDNTVPADQWDAEKEGATWTEHAESTRKSFLNALDLPEQSYIRVRDYLLATDHPDGKAFSVRNMKGLEVKTPDGEIIGIVRTEDQARKKINAHHKAHHGKGSDVSMESYTYDKVDKWMVLDRDRKILSSHANEYSAVARMTNAESDYLAGEDYSQEEIQAIRKWRNAMNRAFDLQVQQLRQIDEERDAMGMPPLEFDYIDETKRWAVKGKNGKVLATFELEQDAKEALYELAKIKPKYAGAQVVRQGDSEITRPGTISDYISMIGDLRGRYFPRQRRSGGVTMYATNAKTGEKIMEQFDLYITKDRKLDTETGEEYSESKLMEMARNSFNRATPLGRRMRALRRQGFDVKVQKTKAMSEDVFAAPGLVAAINAVMTESLANVQQKGRKVSPALEAAYTEIHKAMAANVANIFKARGGLSSRLKRTADYWQGFETDPKKAGVQYAKSLAGTMAKRRAAQEITLAITGRDVSWNEYKETVEDPKWEDYEKFVNNRKVDPQTQPNLYKEVMSWTEEVLRNDSQFDRVVDTIRGLATLKYLGFRVASAAVNLTNLVQAVPANIAHESKRSLTSAMRQMGSSLSALNSYRRGTAGELDKRVFTEIKENGWDQAQFNQENAAVLMSKWQGRYSKVAEWAMGMFGKAEQINRAATIHAAYMELKEAFPSMSHADLMKKAKKVSDFSHGIYGDATRPQWTRGGGVATVAKMPFTFMKFGQNYVTRMLQMVGQKDYKNAAYMLLSPAVLGGAGASLATPIIAMVFKALGIGGEDPEEALYAWASREFGSDALLRHGLPGLAGVSFKGSLQLNNPFPSTMEEILGAPGSLFFDMRDAYREARKGAYGKAVEKFFPTGLVAPFKAAREYNEGVTTGSYSRVYYGDQPLQGTGWDAALRAFSFNPSRLSGIREKQYNERRIASRYQDEKKELYAQFKKAWLAGNGKIERGDWLELIGEVENYNERVKGLALPDVKPIKKDDIRKMLKRNANAPKRERIRAAKERMQSR